MILNIYIYNMINIRKQSEKKHEQWNQLCSETMFSFVFMLNSLEKPGPVTGCLGSPSSLWACKVYQMCPEWMALSVVFFFPGVKWWNLQHQRFFHPNQVSETWKFVSHSETCKANWLWKSDEKFTNKNKAPFLDLCMSGNLPQDSEKPLKADLAPWVTSWRWKCNGLDRRHVWIALFSPFFQGCRIHS